MSGDVIVRPDGMISLLPVLNEIQAAGLTPSQAQKSILEKAANFFEDASATVVVKEIKRRKVFSRSGMPRTRPSCLAISPARISGTSSAPACR